MSAKNKKSEKILLEKIDKSAKSLQEEQRGLEIGQLITLIRGQLGMSQRALAKRASTPQSSISKIELGHLKPNIKTVEKILDALDCDLLITAIPRGNIESIREKQALKKAMQKIQYLKGTMSLEDQEPREELLKELLKEEVKSLLISSGKKLWEGE